MAEVKTISAGEFAGKSSGGDLVVIDVRTPAEFREVHASCAKNIPLDTLDPHVTIEHAGVKDDETIYMICHSGSRSSNACQAFHRAGFDNVVSIEGGTKAWEDAGLPVVRGKKTISLERQVRIAAGFLTLAGAVLGFFVHPYFIGLSAFVGAGLMFAGITDTCGMAMILSKMPWNQVSGSSSACAIR